MPASNMNLHIISFNVPYPPNYGGVIDVFYKIKALSDIGVKITLHTFKYGRGTSDILEELCEKVYYYKRNIFKASYFSSLPYIVSSRQSNALLENLLEDNNPILFEGVHTCYYLNHPSLKDRIKVVRMHNIEHVYYKNLAKIESNLFKKIFFQEESNRLRKFQPTLKYAQAIAAISPEDYKSLAIHYDNVFYLPVFHANTELNIGKGNKPFCLYHGNLAVGENNEAAMYLINEVFAGFKHHLVIAGNEPTKELKKAVDNHPNIVLRSNISTKEINDLIGSAMINLLPTFQNTGMKLKLINVLYQSNKVIVNNKMIKNTGLEELCYRADDAKKMKQAINYLMDNEVDEDFYQQKEEILSKFDTHNSALLLVKQIKSLLKNQTIAT